MLFENEIRKVGEKCGIDLLGFFAVEPLTEHLPHLKKRYDKGQVTGFEGDEPAIRINYLNYFEEAQSGIAFGINSYQKIEKPLDMVKRGRIATVALGHDYHYVLQRKAEQLMDQLNELSSKKGENRIEYQIFIDNSGLIDRGSAHRAGLGFFGKNNCLINEKLGSYFFIGEILLDQKIQFDKADLKPNLCGSCRKCIESCPTGALGDNFEFDPRKCLSYLTQKKAVNKEEELFFKEYLYGCDECQDNCPYNQNLIVTKENAFCSTPNEAYPVLEEISALSNREFKEKYKNSAAGWRGKKIIVRNANLIMKNRTKVI